jgi:DNA-3-methyladenine glycosylase
LDGQRLAGILVESEAYCPYGTIDLACHASKNHGRPTARTSVMFGPPGVAYVYFNYGLHWLFNVVTDKLGQPGAVLIRALEPVEGVDQMQTQRGNRPFWQLTNGPAKITQALNINGDLNQEHLCRSDSVIWIEDASPVPDEQIINGPRIGLGKTPEPWLTKPWRFWLAENAFVSNAK